MDGGKIRLLTYNAYNDIPQPLTVEAVENHIYFYSAVDSDRCLALIRLLRETDSVLQNEKLVRNKPIADNIWLHMHSFGGDVFAAFSVADQIKQLSTPVYSIVEGCVASAATIIATSCTKRFIQPHAFMMVHQISTIFAGTHEELKDEFFLMDMLTSSMSDWYVKHTKFNKEELEEKIKRDFWMSAEQALEYGLVDEILHNY